MICGKTALLAACLALVALLGPAAAQQITPSEDVCMEALGGTNVTVLILAVAYGAHPESVWYLSLLENTVDVPESDTICAYKRTGTLFGQPVLVVATNEGELNSGLCTQEVLQCGPYIKEFIWSGTAGGSPQVGGILNPNNCSAPVDNGAKLVVRTGDVCVSPFSVDWACTAASWSQQCVGYPDVCTAPQYQPGYGTPEESHNPQCVWDVKMSPDMTLADEIIEASATAAGEAFLPKRSAATTAFETAYWGNMSMYTGVDYYYDGTTPQTVWDYTVCMEESSLSYWTGVPYDYLGRVYTALGINQGLGTSLTALDVIGITAEEASGFMMAIYKYFGLPGRPRIPFVVLRGVSDYTHPPVYKTADGIWLQDDSFNDGSLSASDSNEFAISSFSAVVLNLFKSRCEAAGLGNCSSPELTVQFPASTFEAYYNDYDSIELSPSYPVPLLPASD